MSTHLSQDELTKSIQALDMAKGRAATALKKLSFDGMISDNLVGLVAVDIGSSFLGITEEPASSNDGPWVRPFIPIGSSPDMWCARFVYRCWLRAVEAINIRLGQLGHKSRYKLVNHLTGSTSSLYRSNLELGCAWSAEEVLAGKVIPHAGDAWTRNDDREAVYAGHRGKAGHTGLTSAYGDKIYWSLEGNSALDTQTNNGGSVCAKFFRADDVKSVGIVRPTVILI